jgi:hypothetical protein
MLKKYVKMAHCVQFKDVSLNPFKTVRSLGSGMRMIYDANMEALLGESLCQEWLRISCWNMCCQIGKINTAPSTQYKLSLKNKLIKQVLGPKQGPTRTHAMLFMLFWFLPV